MRQLLRTPLFLAAAAAATLACGKTPARPGEAMSDDLKRDLQLASSTSLDLASKQTAASFPLTEVPVASAPKPSSTLKKASGPKAVRTKAPTVKAAPEPTVVANAEEPQTETLTPDPSPVTETTPEPEAPAVPRPSPINPAPAGDGSWSRGGGGSTAGDGSGGSVLGGIFGVIIRGGGVDGDRCEIHTRPPRNRAPEIYRPVPRAGLPRMPGSGTVGGDVHRRGR